MRQTYEAVISDQENLKDKKIIDLAKKNRALQLQAESLKTKAAKAAEFALEMKKENDREREKNPTKPSFSADSLTSSSPSRSAPSLDQEKKIKDMEKKMIKLRNDN